MPNPHVFQISTSHRKLKGMDRVFGLACVGLQAPAVDPIECRFFGQTKRNLPACSENTNALADVWMAMFGLQIQDKRFDV